MASECVLCGVETQKVIYFGLPGRLCADEDCCALTGPAAYAPIIATEDEDGEMGFKFMVYEGSYLTALWHWMIRGV